MVESSRYRDVTNNRKEGGWIADFGGPDGLSPLPSPTEKAVASPPLPLTLVSTSKTLAMSHRISQWGRWPLMAILLKTGGNPCFLPRSCGNCTRGQS